ncbi:MAG TPA: acetyl-CoA decarbonylase/synthase complex subunit alpha/beta [Planctomycetota bacterium]|nr:acetyl-CoA decarbonylase/synthase complex subunit alpha/beta [Planctomycetota bacterium]
MQDDATDTAARPDTAVQNDGMDATVEQVAALGRAVCGGAGKLVLRAERAVRAALDSHGKDAPACFPNTAYHLPIIFAMTGIQIAKLADIAPALDRAKEMLPASPDAGNCEPSVDELPNAGLAALYAAEIIEACKYVTGPNPADGIWLGAADDVLLRERGIEFVEGSAPGFAAVVGAAPDGTAAVAIARQLQEKGIYTAMVGGSAGTSLAEQLDAEGVQMGWQTRLVPFGREITAAAYAVGFAARAALSFGAVQPGDSERLLKYCRSRVPAFVVALGKIDEEAAAIAAGALNFGFPVIADSPLPTVTLPGICPYEAMVGPVECGQIVARAIEVRGLKIKVARVPIPVPYSPAFEGERIRKEEMHCEFGGRRRPAFEFVTTRSMTDVEDGRIEVIGAEIADVREGDALPLAIWVEVAGRKMQADFEPILERQIHRFLNAAQGLFHMGQRDMIWVRIGREARRAGVTFRDIGVILHAKLHDEYSAIFDKVQVKICTTAEQVQGLLEQAREAFAERDRRLAGMTDESVDTFYSCTLCQSFAPNHVCIITPERPGLCGAYSWLDGRAAHEITPTGPNQPVSKRTVIDARLGQWREVNEFIYEKSNRSILRFSAYSIINDPMTSCGCFEAISAVLPMTNGIMIVDRDFTGMTPCGMKFSTLAGMVGGGNQTPGFMGHSRRYIVSRKFISGDGGIGRIVWMPRQLKEGLREELAARAREQGLGGEFVDKIADETIAETEEAVAEHCGAVGHPAMGMETLF